MSDISRLYCLKPIGLGTPLVESLTGHLARLAEAHCVLPGDLIAHELAPILGKEYLLKSKERGGNRFYDNASSFNGMGKTSQDLVSTLRTLTLAEDISYLTLLALQNIISPRGLLSPTRRWCPVCLDEWNKSDSTIYEPLIWNIKCIENCPQHKISLISRCPECNEINPVLNRKTRPGYCSSCGCWLGMGYSGENVLVDNTDLQDWISKNIGDLLAAIYLNRGEQLNNNFIANITGIVQSFSDGRIGPFSESVQIPKSSVWSWYHQKNIPGIESLLKISYCTQIPLHDLLTGIVEVPMNAQLMPFPCVTKRNCSRSFPADEVKRTLEDIYISNDIDSMGKVARQIGWDKHLLYRHFPDLCKAIAQKHCSNMDNRRKEKADRSYEQVHDATQFLLSNGIYPSRRQVENIIDPHICLRESVAKQAWHDVLNGM